jgi:hypothetical protein
MQVETLEQEKLRQAIRLNHISSARLKEAYETIRPKNFFHCGDESNHLREYGKDFRKRNF